MQYESEERRSRERRSDLPAREAGARREIDCAPREGAPNLPLPRTGRGRGTPDPERRSGGDRRD